MGFSSKILIFLLRLVAFGAALSAVVAMVTSRDSATVLGMKFEAKYTNSPTFKYFVLMNAIATVYTFILLFIPSNKQAKCGHLILVLDLIVTLLLDSSISACLALGQLGKKGNIHAGWLPICDQVPKFCDHVAGSLAAGFVGALVYFLISLYSLHNALNLFTRKA